MIRQFLYLSEYNSKTRPSQQAKNVLECKQNDLITAEQNIPLKYLSSATELQELTNTVFRMGTAVKSLETSFIEERTHAQTQKEGLTLREIQGLD